MTNLGTLMHTFDDVETPGGLDRRDGIQRRIVRIRRRRTAATAVAVAAAVFVATGSGYALARPAHHPAPPTAAGTSAPPTRPPGGNVTMPASFTDPDGVVYQRIDQLTLDTSKRTGASVHLPGVNSPIAVVTSCQDWTSRVSGNPQMLIGLAGTDYRRTTTPNFCDGSKLDTVFAPLAPGLTAGMQLNEFDPTGVPTAQGHVVLDFDGSKDVYNTVDGVLRNTTVPVIPTTWTFGIYTWHVPVILAAPGPAPAMPAKVGKWVLHHTVTGIWPSKNSVTFSVPTGVRWGYIFYCPPALAGAVYTTTGDTDSSITENGINIYTQGHLRGGQSCGMPTRSLSPANLTDMSNAHAATTRITLDFAPMYAARQGTWAIGIYYYGR